MVTDYCNCGAKLPEDARFCHKCGKPQTAEALAEEEAAEVSAAEPVQAPLEPATLEPAQPLGISFRNTNAVRTGMAVAGLVSLLLSIPLPAFIQVLWQIVLLSAGGFVAVYLYHRRTGEFPTVRGGARLGWITGVFCFLIMMVLFTISIFTIATGGGLQQFFTEMVSSRGTPEMAEQFRSILQNPAGLGALLFGIVTTFFLMMTILPTLGGAVGAKVLQKD